jgi:hypothetical protein
MNSAEQEVANMLTVQLFAVTLQNGVVYLVNNGGHTSILW